MRIKKVCCFKNYVIILTFHSSSSSNILQILCPGFSLEHLFSSSRIEQFFKTKYQDFWLLIPSEFWIGFYSILIPIHLKNGWPLLCTIWKLLHFTQLVNLVWTCMRFFWALPLNTQGEVIKWLGWVLLGS